MAAVGALVVVLLLVAHTPPIRSFLLGRALASLQSSVGLQVTIDEIAYNLLTLDIRLHGVTVAAAGADVPVAAAAEVRVNMPWSALFGTLAFQDIELTGLAVTLVRNVDGMFNLPALPASEAGGLSSLAIQHLRIQDASVRYDDLESGVSLDVPDLQFSLTPDADGTSSGRLIALGPVFQTPDQVIEASVDGGVTYDGTALHLTDLEISCTLGRLRLGGSVRPFTDDQMLATTIEGTLALDRVSTAAGLDPAVLGTLALTGRFDGSPTSPTGTLTLASERLVWRHLAVEGLNAEAVITGDSLTIDAPQLRLAQGTADLHGRIAFAPLQIAL